MPTTLKAELLQKHQEKTVDKVNLKNPLRTMTMVRNLFYLLRHGQVVGCLERGKKYEG
jgi:hypothetical protein